MTHPSTELESAEARVAASRAQIVAQVHALNAKARRVMKSPYVIGGLAIGAVATGYFAVTHKVKPRALSSRHEGGLAMVLKTAQMLLPLIGTVAAAKVPKRERIATSARMPSPANAEQQAVAAVTPTKSLGQSDRTSRENWLSRQWQMIKAAVGAWIDDYAPSMGAALSYYTLFSLAPMLVIVIAMAGMVFGQEAAQGAIVAQLRGIMGNEGALAVEGLLKSAREPARGVIASVAGFALLLVGATATFAELQSALDRIWRVPAPKKESGVWNLLRTRFLSFGLLLGLGFLLIVSLVVSAALAALGKWWAGWFEGWDVFLQMVNLIVSLGIFTVLFAMIYKIMPRATIPWRDVWTGAAVTSLLFTVGKGLIGLYLGKSGVASGFGAAGSIVVLVAWVYYSAQIFLLGAEYTWIYANRHGSRKPKSAPA